MNQAAAHPIRVYRQGFSWKVAFDAEPDTPLPPDRRLRVGIAGAGDIGWVNAESVRAAPAADVVAVYDTNPEVMRKLAKLLRVPVTASYEELLARPEVDAVLLSVPHHLHAPLAVQAAEAGKHVMLEKPLGVDLEHATRTVEACRKNDVRLTVNFSFRYTPVMQLARQLVAEGVLGEIFSAQINAMQFKGASYWAGGSWGRSSDDWRTVKKKAGGGILIMNASHGLDNLRFASGREVTRVFSEYGTFASDVEVEDTLVATLQFDNGGVASLAASSHWRQKPVDELVLLGTHGSLKIEKEQLTLWSARRWGKLAAGKEHQLTRVPLTDYRKTWIQKFALAVANDEPHDITGLDGWLNNAIMQAAYTSRQQGHAEEVARPPVEA